MDSVTQMLLGGAVAQAGFRRRLGRGAMVAGAAIALVPDLDVAAGWINTFTNWKHHRGLTHSVFFGPVVGPALGWMAWKWHRWRRRTPTPPGMVPALPETPDETLRSWIWLAILALMTHWLIDLPTSYGTQALYPLSDFRFAWNALGIIDVVYSLILIVALVIGFAMKNRPRFAEDAAAVALILVTAYTLTGLAINGHVEARAREQLGPETRVTAYPTLFQPVYRRVVVERPDEILVGYHSVLNDAKPIDWKRFPREQGPAIAAVQASERGRLFTWFSMDNAYWTSRPAENANSLVEASDTRYGVPGDTELGFWGISALVDPQGNIVGEVEAFNRRPAASSRTLGDYWKAVLGN
ncbi:metal-dependent hydrolase [Azospirillum sp. SYSU D00513]|uniref:metal-dependent hydrolase n=1 Tax=Azospirillum sp. SYSU D00513 TaxID=2812561 RepID=UPI001A9700FC|nr:metal-dependent hydrolase [Azospirillum sp. SYSU D00513]